MQFERDLHWQIYSAKAFYFIGGFGFTTWASLIPFLKRNLAIPADHLGFLLLGIGLGALIMMMLAGTIAARLGCRRSLTIAGLCIAAFLNLLCYMPAYGLAVLTAVCLGASLGLMDVVVNINGITPKLAKNIFHYLVKLCSTEGFSVFNEIVNLALKSSFE